MDSKQVSETIQAITDAIKPLAEKIGQGAEHIYMLAAKDCYLDGIANLFYAFLFLAIMSFVGTILFRRYRSLRDETWQDNDCWIVTILWVLIAFMMLFLLLNIDSAVHYLGNPEWAAIQKIAHTVTQSSH